MTSRRLFLRNSALAMFGVGSVPTWLGRALYAEPSAPERKKILIAIFQRGAVDGLNVVVPHGEPAYYGLRPTISIPRPDGTEQSAIDLDGHFGLHPSLHSLKPLWDKQQLAIVEAVGSPDPTRSHFDAQDYMESGTPGLKATYDGWLNRAMRAEPRPSPLRAVSLGPELPRTLRGKNEALAINSINDFEVKDQRLAATFESMYGTTADQVSEWYRARDVRCHQDHAVDSEIALRARRMAQTIQADVSGRACSRSRASSRQMWGSKWPLQMWADGTHTSTKSARNRIRASYPTCSGISAMRWPLSHKTWVTGWQISRSRPCLSLAVR